MTVTHNLSEPLDNTANMQNLSADMIARYAPKARQAISKLKRISSTDNGISGNKIRYGNSSQR